MAVSGIAHNSIRLKDLEKTMSVNAEIQVIAGVFQIPLGVDFFRADEFDTVTHMQTNRDLGRN